jgi:hypothetical protein
MERTFDIKRVGLLLTRQLAIQLKTTAIAAGAVVAFLLVIGVLVVTFGQSTYTSTQFLGLAMPLFFAGGYVLTSSAFAELNNPHRGYLVLMLPATTFEKMLTSWITTSILYVFSGMVIISLVNVLLVTLSAALSLSSVELVNVFSPAMLKMFGIYLVTQSIFLVGAIHFRRAQFFKTILTLFLVLFIVSTYAGIMGSLFFSDGFHMNIGANTFEWHNSSEFWTLLPKILFWGCIAPLMLTVTYFKLKEREV